MQILMVALGGAMGAVSRYLVGNQVGKAMGSTWPYGTFIINIIGCFCMGVLMTVIVERQLLPAAWRLFLCVGFLGGFTTFSSFGYEAVSLFAKGELMGALTYVGGSTLLGLLAAAVGVYLGRAF